MNSSDLESQYELSMLYFLSNNEEEIEESYYWVKKGANKYHTYAQYRLATISENGIVVKKNTSLADNLFTKSDTDAFLRYHKKNWKQIAI